MLFLPSQNQPEAPDTYESVTTPPPLPTEPTPTAATEATIPQGVSIGGVSVGGMTEEQALDAVGAAVPSLSEQEDMVLSLEEHTFSISPETAFRWDVAQAVRTALEGTQTTIFLSPVVDADAVKHYYLSRKFHELTGFTINQYIVHLKIGEAERLLIYEDLPIKEIAGRCGYPNLQYFYATFKKHAGCTPLELKERYL